MIRAASALLAGALLAAAYPPLGAGWTAWAALAPPLVLALTARGGGRAAAEGFLFGAAAHGLAFLWWYGFLRTYGKLTHPEAAGVFLLLAAYVASYSAAFAWAARSIAARRGAACAAAAAPALWAGLEHLRGRLLTGFPWNVLAASQHGAPIFLQTADLGGATLAGFVVACGGSALAAAGLAAALLRRRAGAAASPEARAEAARLGRAAACLLGVVAAAAAYGAFRLAGPEGAARTVRVGLIQGNVPQEEKWDPAARLRILEEHVEATRRAAARGARLVVWPESSVPLPLASAPAYRSRLERLARDLDVDLLVGSEHHEGRGGPSGRFFNSAFLLLPSEPDGDHQRYDKVHLVPFGEHVPLRGWLGPIEALAVEASDFTPGAAQAVLRGRQARLGPLICFEAIFPPLARTVVRQGAQLLVNITNDAMLGDTAGPRQHLALASVRAVETRRTLVRAANTGISAVVDTRGRVAASAPYGIAAEIVADVTLGGGLTLYARLGDVAGWACVILAASLLLALPGRLGGTSWTRNSSDATPP